MRTHTVCLHTLVFVGLASLGCVLGDPGQPEPVGGPPPPGGEPSQQDMRQDSGSPPDPQDMASTPDGPGGPTQDMSDGGGGAPTPDMRQGVGPEPEPDMADPGPEPEPDMSEGGDAPPFENPCTSGPLDAPIEGCAPQVLPSTGDVREDCVRRINQLRWECQCLPPLERWHEGESCADEQAVHDAMHNAPHKGFNERICQPSGHGQNECPRWGSWGSAIGGCLQMMWDEGPGEPFIEHGHYLNMTNPRFSKVACGGSDGWFIQNFR